MSSYLGNQHQPTEERIYPARVIECKVDNEGRIWHKVRRLDFGPEVKDADLPYVFTQLEGNQRGVTTSNGCFSPGQLVNLRVQSGHGGTGHGVIIGAYIPQQNEQVG